MSRLIRSCPLLGRRRLLLLADWRLSHNHFKTDLGGFLISFNYRPGPTGWSWSFLTLVWFQVWQYVSRNVLIWGIAYCLIRLFGLSLVALQLFRSKPSEASKLLWLGWLFLIADVKLDCSYWIFDVLKNGCWRFKLRPCGYWTHSSFNGGFPSLLYEEIERWGVEFVKGFFEVGGRSVSRHSVL